MIFDEWRRRWHIPVAALMELAAISIADTDPKQGRSEAAVTSRVRLEASRLGIHLWRNNRGAGRIQHGDGKVSRYLRWGLANDSKQLGDLIKSADWVGIRPVIITPNMLGSRIGQFISREIKHSGWSFDPRSPEDNAQMAWCTLINGQGGDAKFVTGLGSFD